MADSDNYLTIKAPGEGLFKDRGSKFLAFAYPVTSEDDITQRLHELRKRYHDARHHCYAYRIGADMTQWRANDDGEPSNSAGQPIFGQIRARNLTNVLIVVIRYFGGTLLGVGGLINAYRTAAAEALDNTRVIEKTRTENIEFTFDYPDTNSINKLIKDEQLSIINQTFEVNCQFEVAVPKSKRQHIVERLQKIPSAQVAEQ